VAEQTVKVAKIYARALFDETPVNTWDEFAGALLAMAESYSSSQELRSAFSHPGISVAEHVLIAQDFAKLFSASSTLVNFVSLLAENSRMALLGVVADEFAQYVAQAKDRVNFTIESAFEMSEKEQLEIRDALIKDFGAEAQVQFVVDADMIGGLRVRKGDLLFDGSMRGKLASLRSALLSE
jgi:F-type H+-transporting ATPase subunit delta